MKLKELSKISGYPPQGPGAIGLIIDAAIATHAALTATHGVGTIADSADLTTHAADTSTHGVAEVANAADLTTHIANALANAHSGLLNCYKISDNLLHSHNAEIVTVDAAYTKKYTITLNTLVLSPSTLRIKFDLRAGATGAWLAKAKIYKNGAPVGIERTNATESYQTFSEDLSFAQGDDLELWVTKGTAAAAVTRNFRVYGDEDTISISDAITAGTPGVADPFAATNS